MRISRSSFLGAAAASALGGVLAPGGALAAGAPKGPAMSAQDALNRLLAGNARYVSGKTIHGDHTARRDEVSAGQHPFAMILSCADSRVPAELIFDQSLGDLFVVRLAGNFVEEEGIGSFEYAQLNFSPSVLMILGHSACGAIQATVDALKHPGTKAPGKIGLIVDALMPAAKAVQGKPGDEYANATAENVRLNVAKLKAQKPILAEAVASGKLHLVGAVYDLKTGHVNLV